MTVTREHTIRASRMAAPRIIHAWYQGRASRLTMWNRVRLFFIGLSSHTGHQHANLPLVGSPGVHHAGDLSAA